MRETIIYGGTFDPPTNAHAEIIEQILATSDADIWVMPSADRLDKPHSSPGKDRAEMVRLMIQDKFEANNRLSISRIELEDLSPPTQTIKTYHYLKENYPSRHFRFVVGVDSVATMHLWDGASILISEVPWLIAPRLGTDYIMLPDESQWLSGDVVNISSTLVRSKAAKGDDVSALVSPRVSSWLEKRNLYRT